MSKPVSFYMNYDSEVPYV